MAASKQLYDLILEEIFDLIGNTPGIGGEKDISDWYSQVALLRPGQTPTGETNIARQELVDAFRSLGHKEESYDDLMYSLGPDSPFVRLAKDTDKVSPYQSRPGIVEGRPDSLPRFTKTIDGERLPDFVHRAPEGGGGASEEELMARMAELRKIIERRYS